MKFVCDRCQTRYSIADDKVRGKILKVRCKSCQNVITVREAGVAGSDAAVAPQVNEDRTVMAPMPTAAEPFVQPAGRASAVMPAVNAPPPTPPARDDVQWYVALDGNRTGPFTRKSLLDKLAPLPDDADVHVWNEKLDGWKEPGDVPAIARELQSRRRPPLPPVPGAGLHAAPHPVPGTRRNTGPQPALAAAPASPRRTSHALPNPSGAVAPGGAAVEPPLAAAAAPPPAAGGAPRARKTANGVAMNGSGDHGPAMARDASSPALSLEPAPLSGEQPGPDVPRSPVGEPMTEGAATAGTDVVRPVSWQAGSVPVITTPARHRSAKLMLASLGIVAVIVALVTFSFLSKKAPPPAPVEPPKPSAAADNSFAQLADKLAQTPPAENPPAAVQPVVVPTPEAHGEITATVRGAKGVKLKGKGKRGARGGATPPTSPPPLSTTGAAPAAEQPPAAASYMGGERQVQLHGGGARSTPGQGDITRVINNNKAGIKICYQRALLKDSSLTHGKISVHVTVGLSGKVKNTSIDGPVPFLALQPCIKDLVSRWAFPPSSEAYETEFSYVFQGNE